MLFLLAFGDPFEGEPHVVFAKDADAAQAREDQAGIYSKIRNTNAERLHFAESGDPASQYKMGKAYTEGDGVKQNYGEALRWFLMAADQGYTEAQSMIGRMFFTGQGTARNFEESYFWYSLAAKSGKPQEWADSVGRYISSDQLAAVKKRVDEWKPAK